MLLACLLYVATLWTAQGLTGAVPIAVPRRIRISASALVGLVLAQLGLGALVAGLRAGLVYNTWPLIDGALVPDAADIDIDTLLAPDIKEHVVDPEISDLAASTLTNRSALKV